jgi:nucleoside-diphosphate-sugar epimerase
MTMFTILGASGTIGRRLVSRLAAAGHEVYAPTRGDPGIHARPLGHAIYAIGMTADFRTRPLETVEAHVCVLRELIARAEFESLTYLSSTRVYGGLPADSRVDEDSALLVNPNAASDLYDLSKLMGESLCLHAGRGTIRAVRLSNVIGADDPDSQNFLPSLIREARTGTVTLRTAPDSAKDYVHIEDVLALLPEIATEGRHRLYNLASGRKISHREWTYWLAAKTGCRIEVMPNAPRVEFPAIDIGRVRQEFRFAPRDVLKSVFGGINTDSRLTAPKTQ